MISLNASCTSTKVEVLSRACASRGLLRRYTFSSEKGFGLLGIALLAMLAGGCLLVDAAVCIDMSESCGRRKHVQFSRAADVLLFAIGEIAIDASLVRRAARVAYTYDSRPDISL